MASADVDDRAEIGAGTSVWHLAQVRENARIGRNYVIRRGAYVGPGVPLGDNVKIQNYALVYERAVLKAGVFVDPRSSSRTTTSRARSTRTVPPSRATTGSRSASPSARARRSARARCAWRR